MTLVLCLFVFALSGFAEEAIKYKGVKAPDAVKEKPEISAKSINAAYGIFEVVEEKGDWVKVLTMDDKVGWISANDVVSVDADKLASIGKGLYGAGMFEKSYSILLNVKGSITDRNASYETGRIMKILEKKMLSIKNERELGICDQSQINIRNVLFGDKRKAYKWRQAFVPAQKSLVGVECSIDGVKDIRIRILDSEEKCLAEVVGEGIIQNGDWVLAKLSEVDVRVGSIYYIQIEKEIGEGYGNPPGDINTAKDDYEKQKRNEEAKTYGISVKGAANAEGYKKGKTMYWLVDKWVESACSLAFKTFSKN